MVVAIRLSAMVLSAALVCGGSQPLVAQSGSSNAIVTANDPPAAFKTLQSAGYKAKLVPASEGEGATYIEIETEGGPSDIIFSDCHPTFENTCETLVFSTFWERNVPMTPAQIAPANKDFRYVSVFTGEDGDPQMQWAIFTGNEGIPAKVFLDAFERYAEVADAFTAVAFEGDKPDQEGGAEDKEAA